MEMSLQTMNAVCMGVQTSHGKVEVLSHSVHAFIHLFRDNVQSGMTPDDYSVAEPQDPIISQIVEAIHNKTIRM